MTVFTFISLLLKDIKQALRGLATALDGTKAGQPEVAMRSPGKPGFLRSKKCAQDTADTLWNFAALR
jgi:hypothetical protein